MKTILHTLILAAALLPCAPASAQDVWGLRDFDWYDPLVAEPRAARIAVNFGGTDAFEYSIEPGQRFVWDIHLGRELPMVAFTSGINPGTFAAGDWGVGLWAPVSFHMIEDFKDPSAPIINTDYRFGTMVKARYALSPERYIAARFVPWAHESTHLGDEFSLTAEERFPDTFERINVSYEYWEYGIGYETPRYSIRTGGLQPWGDDGYYSDHLLEPGGRTIPPSHSNFEPSFGAEYRHPHRDDRLWAPFVSLDTRHRILYDYHKPSSDTPEERQWSTTLAAGIRTSPAGTTAARLALTHIYVRVYHGVNPHGQLRNQGDFTVISAGFNFAVN